MALLQDQLLFSVLTIMQIITCSNPESMRSWTNHINGASALARLRGTDQLRTQIGRDIFGSLRIQIVSHGFQGKVNNLTWMVLSSSSTAYKDV